MNIQVINKSPHPLPAYQTGHAAAMDAHAWLPDGPVTLAPLERAAIPTGLFIAIPAGYEMQVRSRSGLSFKHGIMCINSPGTVDADYRGELKILLANLSNEPYEINDGDRVAQLVVSRCEQVKWTEVDELDETARGEGGFGHTGR
jgi:dUTP pyrophosphatase